MAMACLFLWGCTPAPVPPTPDADASSVDSGPTPPAPPAGPSCATWCARATVLGCAAAKPTPAGAPCVDVCANTLDGPVSLNVACRTSASSCAAADECENPHDSARPSGAGDPVLAVVGGCTAWCLHAAALKCPAAKPTPKGATCAEVCTNAQSGLKWDLKCRAAAKTCAAADACEK